MRIPYHNQNINDMTDENIFQILVEGQMGVDVLQSWHESEEEAKTELADLQGMFPKDEFRIEQGTHYIHTKCKGCGTVHANECHDAHGITTGHWCDKCYDDSTIYPYRKDRYPTMETDGYGEYLEEDY